MSVEVQPPPNGVGGMPTLDDILNGEIKHDVEDMVVWDKGVFLNELKRQDLVLSTTPDGAVDGDLAANTGLKKGTYKGTQMALTEMYSLIEEAYSFEPIIPKRRSLEQKKDIYKWSDPSKDGYPPHLDTLPADQQDGAPNVGHIFDIPTKDFVGAIAAFFSFIIPDSIEHKGTPYAGPTLADCEKYNREHPSPNTDITEGQNIGNLADWYSDARFAQQHLSGVNPTTIETAPSEKVKAYVDEAGKQKLEGMKKLLSEGRDLLIQDYSYFREATGVTNEQVFMNTVPELDANRKPTGKVAFRYACASVVIFQLHEDGRLHPLAITLDYRGTLDKSITIFNRRLNPDDKGDIDEKDDWPWRYAKTCAQTADWARHEIAVHLVDTHMVEEAIIVATNRTIPEEHLLHQILSPHWFRTLALNAAARAILVPGVIARLSGFGPSTAPEASRTFGLVKWSYKNFNFQEKYIPNDLKKRGFNLEGTGQGDKYRNYPYANCMSLLWGVIREFVTSVLATKYKSDKDVQDDPHISDWCKEIQTKGQIITFPSITTVDQLNDAVTMCIHTASPQHTAVNYLQDYYYSFVPSKPPALCTPLPDNLKTLQTYTEKELTAALPIGTEGPKWKDWLLAAQLPELLSFKVENRYNLITYARSLYNVNKSRTALENKKFDAVAIKEAAARFYSQLKDCDLAFQYISAIQTEGTIEYKVLQPELTAVSILI
ncbi:hypothetical protein OEA41_000254 [Lepraria neglecta]|uniref:Manganese lipoxygenase n=1 Tax=Lepraria neglecta TaxID=209136 RepID=A0AAE0DPB0_9LECA|nr:hypothetical protein OEA41_000254 [Lepraria neglecta]